MLTKFFVREDSDNCEVGWQPSIVAAQGGGPDREKTQTTGKGMLLSENLSQRKLDEKHLWQTLP